MAPADEHAKIVGCIRVRGDEFEFKGPLDFVAQARTHNLSKPISVDPIPTESVGRRSRDIAGAENSINDGVEE
jgi:hypothetical protein